MVVGLHLGINFLFSAKTPKADETNTFKVNAQRLKPYLGGDLPAERVGLVLTDL